MRYENCEMEIFHTGDYESERCKCTVVLTDDSIAVEYDSDGLLTFRGSNDGSGHFVLTSDQVSERATLHRFPGSRKFEGGWVDGGEHGMWSVLLPESPVGEEN